MSKSHASECLLSLKQSVVMKWLRVSANTGTLSVPSDRLGLSLPPVPAVPELQGEPVSLHRLPILSHIQTGDSPLEVVEFLLHNWGRHDWPGCLTLTCILADSAYMVRFWELSRQLASLGFGSGLMGIVGGLMRWDMATLSIPSCMKYSEYQPGS